jgi:5-methylcytosine-specific restriction protein A
MKKKICNQPGCNILIEQNERYCSIHLKEKGKPFEGAIRFNEELYKTSQWKTLRKKVLAEQPFCAKCGLSDKETKLEVHHIIPARGNEGLFFDRDNLVSVCPICHKYLTNREITNRKRNII